MIGSASVDDLLQDRATRHLSDMTNNVLRRQEERRRRSRSVTLDEDRERYSVYNNPNLSMPLDGPWLKINGDEVIYANSDGSLSKKRARFEEWEEL
ncbi:hypothetical protein NADFUDRAFT_84171 [Nadsonia fulvescens var. elongata DSM 6958]|uniref:Uncharacterized protein n=1 Tax=Nadsonia fulvescens var. elongata DSM 6958 TaxID=857566 RepID=A0A1E3PDP1_9ASCO|nr:hypothetical protein NADFUDRAFT_84171 [Nadsonia fulvescens var. elongata DSM 6958]